MGYIDKNLTFVAEAKAIIKQNYYNEPDDNKLSYTLDYILVHPIKKLKLIQNNRLKIVNIGFVEINSSKYVISRHFNCGGIDYIDLDSEIKYDIPIIGNVAWKVNDEIPAKNILSLRELNDYTHISKEQMYFKLDNIRLRASQIGLESYVSEMNKQKLKIKTLNK